MTINVSKGNAKENLAKSITKAIPNHRIRVYLDRIVIGDHRVKTSPGLKQWLFDGGPKPVKVKLVREDMTAYILAN